MNRREFAKSVTTLLAGYSTNREFGAAQLHLTASDGADRYNVREFGALGNGFADDTTAFERALASAGTRGGTVLVPSGRFPIKRSLHLRDGVILQGIGKQSVIHHDSGEPIVLVCVGVRDAGVHNLAILGQFAFGLLVEQSSSITVTRCVISGGQERWLTSGFCGGVFVTQSHDVAIEDNELRGNGQIKQGILSSDILINGFGTNVSSNAIRIRRNHCESTATQCCISAYDIRESDITGNACSGAKTGPNNNNGYGIMIYQTAGSPGSCFDNTVAHNHVSNTQGAGIYLQQSNRSRVLANVIEDVASVQADETLPVAGVALNQSQHVVIAENRITRVGRAGISIASNRANVGHVEVKRNTIEHTGGMGIHLRGILEDIAVSGNTVTDTDGGIGSYTDHPQSEIMIVDNTVSATKGISPGIVLSNATKSTINKNRVSDSGGYGVALTLGDTASKAEGNLVVRSGRGGPGKYQDLYISRHK